LAAQLAFRDGTALNTLALLAVASLLAVVLATSLPRLDTLLAWTLALLVTLTAGLRIGGFDYDEYLTIIDNVHALDDDELTLRIVAAKDPVFFGFIEAAAPLSEDPRLVFLLVAAVGMACKVLATSGMPRRRTLLLALYTVFLSPGLEFAAIRAGLAVGLALLALSTVLRRRHLWMLLAIASHVSLVVVLLGRLLHAHRRLVPLVLLLAAPTVLPWVLNAGADDPRFSQYLENPGRFTALAMPVLTVLAWLPIHQLARRHGQFHPLLRPEALACTGFSLVVAIVLALPSVTVSFRTLETAWVLIVAQVVATTSLALPAKARLQAVSAMGLLLCILTLSNLLRSTWAALLDLPY
jgi:hypothetical protein